MTWGWLFDSPVVGWLWVGSVFGLLGMAWLVARDACRRERRAWAEVDRAEESVREWRATAAELDVERDRLERQVARLQQLAAARGERPRTPVGGAR